MPESATLPLRMLLTTDGSVTAMLEASFDTRVAVERDLRGGAQQRPAVGFAAQDRGPEEMAVVDRVRAGLDGDTGVERGLEHRGDAAVGRQQHSERERGAFRHRRPHFVPGYG